MYVVYHVYAGCQGVWRGNVENRRRVCARLDRPPSRVASRGAGGQQARAANHLHPGGAGRVRRVRLVGGEGDGALDFVAPDRPPEALTPREQFDVGAGTDRLDHIEKVFGLLRWLAALPLKPILRGT